MSRNKTSITQEKRKEMPPRGKGKKSLMLDAIRSTCKSEQEFLEQLVIVSIGGMVEVGKDEDKKPLMEYRHPNPMLLNLVLNRIEPSLKPISPCIEFEFDSKAKPYEQAIQVLDAVSKGKIPPDIGNLFVASIQAMLKIQEVTEFDERLKAMENKVEKD